MNSLRITTLAMLLLASMPRALSAAPAGQDRPSDPASIAVVLRFNDQPAAKVLEGLFAATGTRGDIDPCVSGRISIALDNVPLGMALDAVARLADLEIRRGEAPTVFRVTCRDTEARRARMRALLPTGEALSLRFRIDGVDADGRSETRAEPRIVVPLGEIAEVAETANVPDYALADDGEVIVKTSRPSWRLRVVVVPGRGNGPREIRGILEISSESSREFEGPVVSLTQPFRGVLMNQTEVKLASAELGSTTWVLTLVGVE